MLLMTALLLVSHKLLNHPVTILLNKTCQATNTPTIPLPSAITVPDLPANAGTIAAVLYSALYILMEPVAGGLLAPLIVGGTVYANHLTSTYGATANSWALGIHVCSWLAQFLGHGKFEGRAPALLDNLVQALFLAPFFVWFEILFYFGYRPELKARLDKAVGKEVKKFRESKNKGAEANGQLNGIHKT